MSKMNKVVITEFGGESKLAIVEDNLLDPAAGEVQLSVEWLRSGKISVPIKATFRLEEIQKAHREYASSSRMGSIVIEIGR